MTADIVQFPEPSDGAITLEQWHSDLLQLHGRLRDAIAKERKHINAIRLVLSIDDCVDLCTVIEEKLGSDFFDND